MTDPLRDRIAAVAAQHDPYDYAGGLECRCGFLDGCGGTAVESWSSHVADAVIAALGLREEKDCQQDKNWKTTYRHRYVTEWTADE